MKVSTQLSGGSSEEGRLLGDSGTGFSRMGSSSAPKPEVPAPSKVDITVKVPSGPSSLRDPEGSKGLNSSGAVSEISSMGGSATGSSSTPRASRCSVQLPSSTCAGLGLPTRSSPWGTLLPSCLLELFSSLASGRAWSKLGSTTVPGSWSCSAGWADSWLEDSGSGGGVGHCLAPSGSWLA